MGAVGLELIPQVSRGRVEQRSFQEEQFQNSHQNSLRSIIFLIVLFD